jgi:hypothetical protein
LTARRSEVPIREYKNPGYLYYPTNLLPHGTRDWERVRFLQACERLNIPIELWPDFGPLELPKRFKVSKSPPVFVPPSFDPLRDSAESWRRRANKLFREHCNTFLNQIKADITDWVERGVLTKIKQRKRADSMLLRFEWAARRHCLGESYKDIARNSKHSPEMIRQAVHRILTSVQIKGVTKRGEAVPSQD